MRIAVLQVGISGFFPRFYNDLLSAAERKGDNVALFVPKNKVNKNHQLHNQQLWGTRWNWHVHYHLYRITGIQDVFSIYSTWDLIRRLRRYNPDIVHLHVVNGCVLCMPMLVRYLNSRKMRTVWTFHDCRAFTGRCSYFEAIECNRWQTGCGACPRNDWYAPSLIDNTALEWKIRRKWHSAIENLYIVTPSEWLAGLVRLSFLKDKPLRVINNGIDVTEFSKSTCVDIPFWQEMRGKKVVLAVAASWNVYKGADTIVWLASHLPDDHLIVVVGRLKEQMSRDLAGKAVCIAYTESKEVLIGLFQRADVFVNATITDNFPTVNLESLGAGTPVVTYRTGGSAECLAVGCGLGVVKGDRMALLQAVLEVTSHPEIFTSEKCIKRARHFSEKQFDEYVDLYHEMKDDA